MMGSLRKSIRFLDDASNRVKYIQDEEKENNGIVDKPQKVNQNYNTVVAKKLTTFHLLKKCFGRISAFHAKQTTVRV